MATTFKPLGRNDVISTKTLLHENIPLTGTIVSGTYSDDNVKTYSHGMFQSVYDYPYLSSSANHIFDLTVGYANSSPLSGTDGTRVQQTDKINIYNQMAQVLAGHDLNGNIRMFDRDGDLADSGDESVKKMDSVFFMNFSRLLVKDEIKKGSFKLQMITGSADSDPAKNRKDHASVGTATATLQAVSENVAQYDEGTLTLIDAEGTSKTYVFHNDSDGDTGTTSGSNVRIQLNGLSSASTIAAQIKLAIEHSAGHNGTITVTVSSADAANDTLTLTQASGAGGNTDITRTMTFGGTADDVYTVSTVFAGGSGGSLALQDHNGETSYLTNSPAGEYGLLFTSSADASTKAKALGHIYYQAGIAVVTSSIFRNDEYMDEPYSSMIDNNSGEVDAACGTKYPGGGAFGWLPGHVHGSDYLPTGSVEAMFVSASISGSCSGFRNALYNVEFNNTTELNSTIYFCRAGHNEFNYTSNPTYVKSSKIVVKNTSLDRPVSYITSIGLYSAKNELLAVAKLSEPIKKTPDTELTFRVRLDY